MRNSNKRGLYLCPVDKPSGREREEKRKTRLQGAALGIIFALAILSDGLMDTLGMNGYLLAGAAMLAAAGGLTWLSNRPGRRRRD